VRLHQEDFAQALGLPAELKYERRGRPGRRFDVAVIGQVLNATVDPAQERDRFIQSTMFDLLTGNVDAHAKNHALMHLGRGRVCSTPRYDLLPTRLDPNLTDELPFKIGDAETLAAITAKDFDAFLATLGIATPAARKRVTTRSAKTIADGLAGALAELNDKGMKLYADLIASNMRQLLPVLGVPVPQTAQNRDAFVGKGGGWQVS
jgi:serine/threonine-protein kinase HipA